MSYKVVNSNYRVEVEPRGLGHFGSVSMSDRFFCRDEADRQAQYKQRCEEIVAQIKRHIDDVGNVRVIWDSNKLCEHCGSNWTEVSARYNGGCCDADEANNPDIPGDPDA